MDIKIISLSEISEREYYKLYNCLPISEKERIDAILNQNKRMASLAARKLIQEYSGHVDIKYTPTGKPYFENSDTNLSISHSKDMALVVFSKKKVGADIEHISKINSRLANKYFTTNEKMYIGNEPEKFTLVWTLKEAVLKATGQGIAGLAKVSIEFDGENSHCTSHNCQLFTQKNKDFIISVCELD